MSTRAEILTNAKNECRDADTSLTDALYWFPWLQKIYDEILEAIQAFNSDYFLKKHSSSYTFTSTTQFQEAPTDYKAFVKLVASGVGNSLDIPEIPKGDVKTGKAGYVLTFDQTTRILSSKKEIGIIGDQYMNTAYDLWYIYKPFSLIDASSSDSDIPALDADFHFVLTYGVIYQYYRYRQDSKSDYWKNEFMEGIQRILKEVPSEDDKSFNNQGILSIEDEFEM